MNVEATATATSTVNTQNNVTTTTSDSKNVTNKDGNSFKEELNVQAKSEQNQAEKIAADKNTETNNTINNESKNDEIKNNVVRNNEIINKQYQEQENATNPISKKDIAANIKENSVSEKELYDSLCDLNEKIKDLNELKNLQNDIALNSIEKNQYLDINLTEKSELCKTISMDKSDTTFFLNLVENQTMTAQSAVNNNTNINNQIQQQFQEVKAEATQKTVAVSQTLIDCLNESMKTNKPFRIDFGEDVAVIMKVDKDGVLSANFIPGSSAVENYLRSNIGYLRQSFEEQNLEYNELSYTRQDGKKQKQNGRNNQKDDKES